MKISTQSPQASRRCGTARAFAPCRVDDLVRGAARAARVEKPACGHVLGSGHTLVRRGLSQHVRELSGIDHHQ